jgi:hypothetical protein
MIQALENGQFRILVHYYERVVRSDANYREPKLVKDAEHLAEQIHVIDKIEVIKVLPGGIAQITELTESMVNSMKSSIDSILASKPAPIPVNDIEF